MAAYCLMDALDRQNTECKTDRLGMSEIAGCLTNKRINTERAKGHPPDGQTDA